MFDVWCRRTSHVEWPGNQPLLHAICQEDTTMDAFLFLLCYPLLRIKIKCLQFKACTPDHTFANALLNVSIALIFNIIPIYLFPNSCQAFTILLSFDRLGLCVSFSSLSMWCRSTRGAIDGRPWAHWKGSWQADKDATRLKHSSFVRMVLNFTAPWHAKEASTFCTVRGSVALSLPAEWSSSICSRR